MAAELLVGLDVGTSAVDACAFSLDGRPVAAATVPLAVVYPRPGWAEQEAALWSGAAGAALRQLAGRLGARAAAVAAVGLGGQCPSFALVDDAGAPLTPGLIHQDSRATAEATRIAEILGADAVWRRTGAAPSQYYVAAKAMWLGRHRPALRAQRPWLAQPRDLVAQRLTGAPATDETHAGCTGLYDLHARAWAEDWLAALDLAWLRLPPILLPAAPAGPLTAAAAGETGLPVGLPVVIGAADNFCADLAMGAIAPGCLGDTTGTSTCLDLTIDDPAAPLSAPAPAAPAPAAASPSVPAPSTAFPAARAPAIKSPAVPVPAAARPVAPVPALSLYAHLCPGRLFVDAGLTATGAVIAWAAAALAGGDVARLEALAAAAPPDGSAPLLLPYLTAERSDATATGIWHGLSLAHGPARLARSAYEGVTFALRELVDAFRAAGYPVTQARLGGGGSRSALWNGLKADVWGLPVRAAESADATALGAALLAGVATGLYRDLDDAVARAVRLGPTREPHPDHQAVYGDLYGRWQSVRAAQVGR